MNQQGIPIAAVNICCCLLLNISLLIVCSTVNWLAGPIVVVVFLLLAQSTILSESCDEGHCYGFALLSLLLPLLVSVLLLLLL